MRTTLRIAALLLAASALAACESIGDRQVLSLDATGAVVGVTFIDRNGDRERGAGDTPLSGVRVSLVVPGTERAVASATTDATGTYRLTAVPIGNYNVSIDPAVLGDSLRIVRVDTADITVSVRDTLTVTIAVGYPTFSAGAVRALPVGRLVTLEGIALNAATTFSDASVSLSDSSGVIRVVGLPAASSFAAGDSIRIVGRRGTRDGQPVVTTPASHFMRAAEAPAPRTVTTAVANAAENGALDARLVRITGATILDARGTQTGDTQLTVTDGSGTVDIILDRRAGISSPTGFSPGSQIDATGILVPRETEQGRWWMKPRTSTDIAVSVPTVRVVDARTLPVGRRVAVEGVALNGWATFGDGSVHLADPTGAIRAVSVPSAFLFAGDSIRLVGVLGVRDGQPVMTQVTTTIFGKSPVPPPLSATTETAASANGGRWDAALVRVTNATISDTATVGVNFRLTVNDGSGALEVFVARDTGIGRGPYVPGARIDATGVLVPLPSGTSWRLQPRSREDLPIR